MDLALEASGGQEFTEAAEKMSSCGEDVKLKVVGISGVLGRCNR